MIDLEALRLALRTRMEVVANRSLYERDPARHLHDLMAASALVDELAGQLPMNADPMLRHYLERQSYVKALDWLDAQTA